MDAPSGVAGGEGWVGSGALARGDDTSPAGVDAKDFSDFGGASEVSWEEDELTPRLKQKNKRHQMDADHFEEVCAAAGVRLESEAKASAMFNDGRVTLGLILSVAGPASSRGGRGLFISKGDKLLALRSHQLHWQNFTGVSKKRIGGFIASVWTLLAPRRLGRLQAAGWAEEKLEHVETEHAELRNFFRDHDNFRITLEEEGPDSSFKDSWGVLEGMNIHLSTLKEFCGTLSTVFPTTATVEADFSAIGIERDDYRESLTDFSLEDGSFEAPVFEIILNGSQNNDDHENCSEEPVDDEVQAQHSPSEAPSLRRQGTTPVTS
ncbi:unnamed protein product [Cyprideis torosa]|uniref:Uncharacterized protein n=1 Tax=Cyprideis torosa TaxID=163714 RepID=A0A7R8ZS46_9CRUS|nr:unnamed protein product [Cyprideis torosa]CAG0895398.1 unnamed protein product [Cyprideis torosa]